MAIKCNTAYWDKRSILVFDLSDIRQHYFGTAFRFDVIAAVPLDLLARAAQALNTSPLHTTAAWHAKPETLNPESSLIHKIPLARKPPNLKTLVPNP